MAVEEEGKGWGLCRIPFWGGGGGGGAGGRRGGGGSSSSSNASSASLTHHRRGPVEGGGGVVVADAEARRPGGGSSVVSVARSLIPARRRLRLDPPAKLYFPYEPGKQVRSAVRIKNTSKSYVAFKFQTTAPKSCFMRPPGGVLSPGESIVATVFKFVEHPENNEKPMDQKCKVKFKIISLKVKGPMEYVPELFDEQKDQVAVEQILRVVFLDVDRPSPQMDKLKRQLAEADAALEARKKPPEDTGSRIVGEGLVIDEWKERRERYLARQQVEGVVDSV
ncbi:vesicle-associated protein 4-1-like [Ananas comosus]|uniref:Vesicle-associated protein 4-1-like n=1 Tax=Ananas comosus TaxID=4615 RepID=A0A6P5FWL9_ANACO|nr:vesicle-associated protein 4-1-like [Ananas comosus]